MPFDFPAFYKSLTALDYAILGFSLAIWLFRFLFDLIFYGRLAYKKVAPAGSTSIPITVFFVVRNEEERLRENLPQWLEMGYPHYEILVVNDFSEDNTLAALALLRNDHLRLKFTSLNQETRYSEKLARNLALKAASHEMVVMSNITAIAPDNHWLPGISAAINNGKDVVIGYCGLVPQKYYAHKLYRVESFFQQIDSMAYSLNGFPYVTAEENVTFRKSAYFDIGGLAGKIREEYLNLEMVVNETIRKGKVAVLPVGNLSIRKNMEVDNRSLRDLFIKSFRLRKHIKSSVRFVHKLSAFTSFLFTPVFIFLLIYYPQIWIITAGLFALKAFTYVFFIKRLQNRLHESKIFVNSLLYAAILPYYRIIARWRFGFSSKRRRWRI